MTRTLDLGSGSEPKNPFGADEVYGVDLDTFGNENIRIADVILNGIPFEDDYFDYVTGYDFIEHIPRLLYIDGKRRAPFMELMSEIWRVLKPGGTLKTHTPAVPYSQTFQDPTHVNFITEATVSYFIIGGMIELGNLYGFEGQFELLNQYWDQAVPYHLVWELKKV